MTVSTLLISDVPYHRVYEGKKYLGLVLMYPDKVVAKIAHSRRYRDFKTKEDAVAWIEKTYWNQEYPS